MIRVIPTRRLLTLLLFRGVGVVVPIARVQRRGCDRIDCRLM